MINNRTLLPSPPSSSPSSEYFFHCLNLAGNNNLLGPALAVKSDGVGVGMEMSMLERQRAVLKLQQEQQRLHLLQFPQQQSQHSQPGAYLDNFTIFSSSSSPLGARVHGSGLVICSGDSDLKDLSARPIKADQGLESGSNWPEIGRFAGAGDRSGVTSCIMDNSGVNPSSCAVNFAVSRATSCQPAPAGMPAANAAAPVSAAAASAMESFKKRKTRTKALLHPPKLGEEEDGNKAKKIKGCCAEEEKEEQNKSVDQQKCNNRNSSSSHTKENKSNREVSGCTSKENNSMAAEAQKPDYIHVRARRGQATDSHSLAERVRREKISKRMKYLQDLVPGCNKITGKAGMLDEIINYVQSLQSQIEFLTMKLAAVNPRLEFNIDDFFAKEVSTACSSNYATMGVSSDMANNSGYNIQYNPTQQIDQICGFELGMNGVDMGIRRTISAPVSLPSETFLDSSCSTQQMQSCLPWDSADLQSIHSMEFQ